MFSAAKEQRSLHQSFMQLRASSGHHLHQLSVIQLLLLWRIWSNSLCKKENKKTQISEGLLTERGLQIICPASSSLTWEPNSPVQTQERSSAPAVLSPTLFRFPAPLSGPAGALASALVSTLSATAAVRVEQLWVGTHTVCGSAEWWHCTVALSATEGPFVSRGTQASYTQHNEPVHSFSA